MKQLLNQNILYGRDRKKFYKMFVKILMKEPGKYTIEYQNCNNYYTDIILVTTDNARRVEKRIVSIRQDLHFLR